MNSLVGRLISNYRVVELLGQGGMAQVYRAEHIELGRSVALKVMHPHLAAQRNFLERFRREAKAIARLDHPNIVRVYDFIVPDDMSSPCIVMQLIQGPTLRDCLKEAARREEKWSLPAILRLVEMLADAIDYAHAQGMVHRDIKPGNIILQPASPDEPLSPEKGGYTLAPALSVPILTDFGMARLLDDSRLTVTGSVTGTPTYLSPEQAQGERGAAASDIYSFGVVVYEMVVGQVPFESDTPIATLLKHISELPPSPRRLRPHLKQPVEDVLLKVLSKAPEDRYPNAKAFAHSLRQAIERGMAPTKVSPHIRRLRTPEPISDLGEKHVSPRQAMPITLDTVSQLRSAVQRGSGYPLAAGQGRDSETLILITTAGIELVSPASLQTKKVVWRSDSPLVAGAVAPAGTVAIMATLDHQLLVLDISTGHQPVRPIQLAGEIVALTCSQSGRFIGVCLKDRQGLLIELPDGQIAYRWQSGVRLLAFNPVEDIFAFVDQKDMLRLVQARTQAEITRIDLLKEDATAITFSRDGKLLAVADKRIRWWEAATGAEIGSVPAPKGGITTIDFSPQESLLAVTDGRDITLWNLATQRKTGDVRHLSPRWLRFVGPSTLLVNQVGGEVQLYDLNSRQVVARRQFDSFTCAALLPDGRATVTGDRLGTVKLWGLTSDETLFRWQAKQEPLWAMATHPYRPLVAIAGTTHLWYLDLATQRVVGQSRVDGAESRMSFSKDGRNLLLQKGGGAWVFDANNYQAKPSQFKVEAATFVTDGQMLAAIQKAKLQWINVVTGQQRVGWPAVPSREVVFSESGQLVAIVSKAGDLSIWNKTGKRLLDLHGVEGEVYDVAFASDNLLLTAIDRHGRLNFWDVATASKQSTVAAHYGRAWIAGYSHDATQLVTAGSDGLVRWWSASSI